MDFVDGGSVVNGSASNTRAKIIGRLQILIANKPGTVTNYGTIQGYQYSTVAVSLAAGGQVVNGSLADGSARIASNNLES